MPLSPALSLDWYNCLHFNILLAFRLVARAPRAHPVYYHNGGKKEKGQYYLLEPRHLSAQNTHARQAGIQNFRTSEQQLVAVRRWEGEHSQGRVLEQFGLCIMKSWHHGSIVYRGSACLLCLCIFPRLLCAVSQTSHWAKAEHGGVWKSQTSSMNSILEVGTAPNL